MHYKLRFDVQFTDCEKLKTFLNNELDNFVLYYEEVPTKLTKNPHLQGIGYTLKNMSRSTIYRHVKKSNILLDKGNKAYSFVPFIPNNDHDLNNYNNYIAKGVSLDNFTVSMSKDYPLEDSVKHNKAYWDHYKAPPVKESKKHSSVMESILKSPFYLGSSMTDKQVDRMVIQWYLHHKKAIPNSWKLCGISTWFQAYHKVGCDISVENLMSEENISELDVIIYGIYHANK